MAGLPSHTDLVQILSLIDVAGHPHPDRKHQLLTTGQGWHRRP
jgi:hypothetical protein